MKARLRHLIRPTKLASLTLWDFATRLAFKLSETKWVFALGETCAGFKIASVSLNLRLL